MGSYFALQISQRYKKLFLWLYLQHLHIKSPSLDVKGIEKNFRSFPFQKLEEKYLKACGKSDSRHYFETTLGILDRFHSKDPHTCMKANPEKDF